MRQNEERRRAGGGSGHEEVLSLVELKGQGRQRGGGTRQRGMRAFGCLSEQLNCKEKSISRIKL